MARSGQTLQTRQWARPAHALHGRHALHLAPWFGLWRLLSAFARTRLGQENRIDGGDAQDVGDCCILAEKRARLSCLQSRRGAIRLTAAVSPLAPPLPRQAGFHALTPLL